jgi:predicted lactoylglutathione lyase
MPTKIFVNLPVKDLKKSIAFFTRLGFTFNPQLTDETATCMIVGEDIFVMLLTHAKFKTFTPNPICDATQSTEVLVCLSSESRVGDGWCARPPPPAEGVPALDRFMYEHAFQDLTTHLGARSRT